MLSGGHHDTQMANFDLLVGKFARSVHHIYIAFSLARRPTGDDGSCKKDDTERTCEHAIV